MGEDSVTPFLTYEGEMGYPARTDQQQRFARLPTDGRLKTVNVSSQKVLRKSQEWANDEQMMYVVGATQGRAFEDIRKIVPNHFLFSARRRCARRFIGRGLQVRHEQDLRADC